MAHINNIKEFARHISNHRTRVYALGMTMRGPKILKTIIFGLHDIEKYFFIFQLWKYYGSKGHGPERRKAIELYTRMNKLGYIIISVVLFFVRFPEHSVDKVKRLEKVIDVIDRHCDPVALEEFNLKEKRPLTQFLDVKDLPLAMSLKKKWLDLFENNK